MGIIRIGRLFFLAALVIAAVLTACPPADSNTKGDSVPRPTFKNLGINIADKKIIISFNTDIEIVDNSKIRVEVKAEGKKTFSKAPVGSIKVNTGNLLELTLINPAIHNNVYRVKVGPKALRSTISNLANTTELTSSQTTYSTSPILNPAPYILDNKLVAIFNLPIVLKDWTKVKVYKNPARSNEEINLNKGDIAVNNKNLLEITLPKAVAKDEVYRLRLDAGAVSEEGKTANGNEVIAPTDLDITIGASPALDIGIAPSLSGHKIIVTFDTPIRILDKTGIKYQLNGTTTIPSTNPAVVNNNQLEIPLNDALADGHVYRIDLTDGALGGGKNQPSTSSIQPEDKDITVWLPVFTKVKPAFDSATQLGVTFPVDVAIVGDGSTINVQKKDDGGSFTTLTAEQRTIEIDCMNTKKINIILTGSEKITPYTQVWKVEFSPNTVKTRTDIPNAGSLTTLESEKPRLTDLYSWEEVNTEGNKWTARYGHTSVVFDSKIWVMGGSDGNSRNDVWSSADGEAWEESTPPNDKDGNPVTKDNTNWWTARLGHTSVVFDSKIWVMGGYDGNNRSDVWSSPDGANWTESTPPNDKDGNPVIKDNKNWWGARVAHTSVVFPRDGAGKKIWVIGGFGNALYNDVWSSTDGSNWVEENANTGMGVSVIYQHASAVFDDKIWAIGGIYATGLNGESVWSSPGGKTWTRDAAALPSRISSYPKAVEYKDRLWSLGGNGSSTKVFLSSADPATGWTAEDTLESEISATQAVVFKNRIWLLGGDYGGSRTDRVWKMGPGTE